MSLNIRTYGFMRTLQPMFSDLLRAFIEIFRTALLVTPSFQSFSLSTYELFP